MGDLQGEKEDLSAYLESHFKIESSPLNEGLSINAEKVSPQELERIVNKFVYHRNLNSTHWVELDKNVVKIRKFEHTEKTKKNKHPITPSIIKHGW
jgi:hypothetical protein